MRRIDKGSEPPSLTAHRQTPYAGYDNYPDKDELRRALVAEQRGLCCYCMAGIRPDVNAMKIEHWRCQARHPNDELSYRNLLAACRGGEDRPYKHQHCDTRKGDRDLQWNPADSERDVEARLGYGADGEITSDDDAFNHQINEVLNLNLAFLKAHRKDVLTAVLDWWKRQHRPVPRDRIEREIDRYAPGHGQLTPYCQVAVWWLNRKLAGMP